MLPRAILRVPVLRPPARNWSRSATLIVLRVPWILIERILELRRLIARNQGKSPRPGIPDKDYLFRQPGFKSLTPKVIAEFQGPWNPGRQPSREGQHILQRGLKALRASFFLRST